MGHVFIRAHTLNRTKTILDIYGDGQIIIVFVSRITYPKLSYLTYISKSQEQLPIRDQISDHPS